LHVATRNAASVANRSQQLIFMNTINASQAQEEIPDIFSESPCKFRIFSSLFTPPAAASTTGKDRLISARLEVAPASPYFIRTGKNPASGLPTQRVRR